MVNQLFFSLDILLLTATGTDSSLIAAYKIATIIPYSLFILPGSFLSADLLHLTRHSHDRSALMEYIRSYFSIFALLTPILIAMLWFLSEPLIEWCFGNNYPLSASLQNIFLVGLAGTFLLRIPFGNILQAVGKANWNVWHAVLLIPLSAIAMHQAIETHGVIGAAWVTSITFLISGIISLLLFGLYLRTLAKSNHQ
jgi:O-antigen/teichoic acid export membrane protein